MLLDRNGRIACDGLVVNWNNASASATYKVPSTCLWQGNYGAVRPWFLTEGLNSGSDIDLATSTEFVPAADPDPDQVSVLAKAPMTRRHALHSPDD